MLGGIIRASDYLRGWKLGASRVLGVVLALPRERRALRSGMLGRPAGRVGLIQIGRRHPHLSLLVRRTHNRIVYLIDLITVFRKENWAKGPDQLATRIGPA